MNFRAKTPLDSVREPPRYERSGQTTIVNESWRTLYEKVGDIIRFYARQAGLNEHSADDVLQEAMMTVLKAQMGQAAGWDPGKGSFKAWLMGVVRNCIRCIRRRDQKERPLPPPGSSDGNQADTSLPDIPQPPEDHEEVDERRWQMTILAAALQKVRERVQPENFAIFMALSEERETPQKLAKAYGKTKNNIYRIKHSCQSMVSTEAKAIQKAWDQLGQLPP